METMMLTATAVLSGVLGMSLVVVRQMQAQRVKEQRLRAFVAR